MSEKDSKPSVVKDITGESGKAAIDELKSGVKEGWQTLTKKESHVPSDSEYEEGLHDLGCALGDARSCLSRVCDKLKSFFNKKEK